MDPVAIIKPSDLLARKLQLARLKRSELGVLGIRLFEDPFKLWLQVAQHGVDPVGAHVPEGERLPAQGSSSDLYSSNSFSKSTPR